MKTRIRDLLRATPFRPFIICMADGRQYRIEHPDFVLAAASDVPQITIEDPDGRQHYLSALAGHQRRAHSSESHASDVKR